MSKELSLDEKVLLAAYDMERNDKTPFSAEDLVIAAWRKFPDAFGLEGYGNEHPDSNRVFTKIMGSKGLRGRGWLIKVGEKLYQLSEAGKIYAQSVVGGEVHASSRSILDRKQKDFLQRLLQTKALQKIRSHRNEEIIFVDACSFWDISPRTTGSTLAAKLASVESLISYIRQITLDGKSLALFHGGIGMTLEDVEDLIETHQFMLERFREELSIIRGRKDDRKSN